MDSNLKNTGFQRNPEKAAQCGEPSYIWRAGQARRLEMILQFAGDRVQGNVLENGCGVGMYVKRLTEYGGTVIGLEYDFQRAYLAHQHSAGILNAAGEDLPFPNQTFDLILSHEVLEHVRDDHRVASEMVRVLRPGGRALIFVPNRGYPFETHGIYWRGQYRFGNIPLVNYLPYRVRDKLAPHVRIYTSGELGRLFSGQPVRIVNRTIIFGAYDNIIARNPAIGKMMRNLLQRLEHTPLSFFGLSHFWVVEKT